MSDNQVLDQSINEVLTNTVPETPVKMSNSLYISDNEQSDIDLVNKILNDISENIKEEYTKSNDNIEAADIPSLSDSDDNIKEEDKLEEEEEEEVEEDKLEEEEKEEEVEVEEDKLEEEEEEEVEVEEDKLEEEEDEEAKVRYIHAIILKERNNDLPFPIVFMGTLLMFLYGLKLFISICNV
jgi:hypothetical protein